MADQKITRRRLMQIVSAAGAASAGIALVGCGGGDEKKQPEALNCSKSVAPADAASRTSSEYVEKSADPAKNCLNCNFFKAGGGCGTCTVVKGSINPGGYCKLWVKKA